MVTFDRWQSFDIQQELKQVSITTETLSVAKKHYEDLITNFLSTSKTTTEENKN